jgi:heme exporter protein C
MKFFRSNLYYWLLGILLAIGTYVSIATPVAGNFRDVAMLTMSDPNSTIPVKAQIIEPIDGKPRARDKSGIERTIEMAPDQKLNLNDYFIADFSYRPADSTYILKHVVSVNPSFAFPYIPGLGELGKNMLFHVPMSFVAFILFFLGTVYSFLLVKKKDMKYDLQAKAFSAVALLYTVLATVTGSIWAKASWGRFWRFDPRESSILVLLLIYIAYFLLRSLLEEGREKKARIAAVYNMIAFVTVPFLMFVLPRITESLHPGGGGTEAPVINTSGKSYTDQSLSMMLWSMVILFLGVAMWMKDLYVRISRVEEKTYV